MNSANATAATSDRSPSEWAAQLLCFAPPMLAIGNLFVGCGQTDIFFSAALLISALTTILRGTIGHSWTGGSRYTITCWLGTLACFATIH